MLTLYADLIVKDKQGRVTEQKTIKCDSFLRQFLDLLYTHFKQAKPTAKDIENVDRTLKPSSTTFAANAGSGEYWFGCLVGAGNTAPTISDYVMETQFGHGTGVNQFQYGGVTFGAPTCDATSCHCTITRNFSNASGGAITVNEIGLAVKATNGGTQYYLIIRDVIGGGVAVPNGQTLTLNYRVKITS